MVNVHDEDLSRFRYYTGAPLRRIEAGEPCPILFRDLGPIALERHLRGTLPRLAGPLTPLLFMRSANYREPYIDYEDIGRLVFLQPKALGVWCSGVPHVFVARATRSVAPESLGFAPPGSDLRQVERLAADASDAEGFREALGGRVFDEAKREALARAVRVNLELACSERSAAPLRAALKAQDARRRAAALEQMARLELSEEDLCTAWHHLPRARREQIDDALERLDRFALRGSR